MTTEITNMKVSRAGYFYIGHYRWAELRIILENNGIGVEVNPKLSEQFDMFDLFRVFDIDPEDGKYLQEIEGKYCRVIFGEGKRVAALQHLIKDNVIWHVEGAVK